MTDGQAPTSSPRLVTLDVLRGLALTIVLVDHIDDLIHHHDFFTRWTLKGIGPSDAAEAFVFLSGFTFGRVYSPRVDRDGFLAVQRRVLLRTARIAVGLLATTLIVAALAWSLSRTSLAFHLPLTVTTPTMFIEEFRDTATFRNPVWGVAILVVYIAILPFLPSLLWLARRSTIAAVTLSLAIYAGTQLSPELNFSDAGFNPLAWQILMVSGAILGSLAHSGRISTRLPGGLITAAALTLIAGFLAVRGPALEIALPPAGWTHQSLAGSPLFSKTNLGPVRILHFAALAIVVTALIDRWPRLWTSPWTTPLAWSGRHSLVLFCLGVVLAYLAAAASPLLPSTLPALLFLAADATLIQFAAAWFLETRSLTAGSSA